MVVALGKHSLSFIRNFKIPKFEKRVVEIAIKKLEGSSPSSSFRGNVDAPPPVSLARIGDTFTQRERIEFIRVLEATIQAIGELPKEKQERAAELVAGLEGEIKSLQSSSRIWHVYQKAARQLY